MLELIMSIDIIGGGPAGSTASIFLAKSGFDDIKLYEKSVKVRKPCGGGLTFRVLERYDYLLEGLKTNPIKTIVVDIDNTIIKFGFKKVVLKIVDRLKLDEHLRKIAKSLGVKIIGKNVEPKELNGKLVIDARGFDSEQKFSIAKVAICKLKDSIATFIFRKKFISKGYFWIFPINEKLANIGCAGTKNGFKTNLDEVFDWFIEEIGAKPLSIMNYPITVYSKINSLIYRHDDKIVVKVGERAGLVNPLTGEGIYHAIRSSEILAECIKDDVFLYQKRIEDEFKKELTISKFLVDSFPIMPNFLKKFLLKHAVKIIFPSTKIIEMCRN
ncbi:MAG: NAD(P)/FAD-dependent oxidoreductase [Candidatus Aenigmatarchaeota archaeon]